MTIGSQTSLPDLAFIVCTALAGQGDIAILTGGGAATVYAPEAYQSKDLDFVFSFWTSLGAPSAKALTGLGFYEKHGFYHHPDTLYTIDFPQGPLAVGSHTLSSWNTLRQGDLLLHILWPTDSVRDRLSSFFFYKDFSALDQALAIARRHQIDMDSVRAWAISEGSEAEFDLFASRLTSP